MCEQLYYYHPLLGFNYRRDTQYTTISCDIIIVALRRLWQYIIFTCRSGYKLCSCMETFYHKVYNKFLKCPSLTIVYFYISAPEIQDVCGSTPLHVALMHGHEQCAELLRSKGADFEKSIFGQDISSTFDGDSIVELQHIILSQTRYDRDIDRLFEFEQFRQILF